MKKTDPDFNPNLAFQIISRGQFTPAFPYLLFFSSSFVFQLSCFCIPDLLLNRLFALSTICSLLPNSFHISISFNNLLSFFYILGWCRSCRHLYPIRSSSFFWPVLRVFWEVLWSRGNAGCKKVPATILIMFISLMRHSIGLLFIVAIVVNFLYAALWMPFSLSFLELEVKMICSCLSNHCNRNNQ